MIRCMCSVAVPALFATSLLAGEVRYFSTDGHDAADGRTPQTAWRSIDRIKRDLPAGATALLRRGDTFFCGGIELPAGPDAAHRTTLAAYGTGEKPVITVSKIIRNDPSAWQNFSHNFWRVRFDDPTNVTGSVTKDSNPGFLLVDGEVKAWKRFSPFDLVSPWDFSGEDGWLYVHAEANPATLAKEIRVAMGAHAIRLWSHTAVSNIAVRVVGNHGLYAGWAPTVVEDMRVSDCDFENIGGSELFGFSRTFRIRFGNGVEFGSNSRDAIVERCTFRGVYDVAVTMQGIPTVASWADVHFRDCTMEDCTQAFEIWCRDAPKGIGFKRCSFTGNRTKRVGGGWGMLTRPCRVVSTPLLMYGMDTDTVDIDVSGNTFEDAPRGLMYKSGGLDKVPKGYRIHDNVVK